MTESSQGSPDFIGPAVVLAIRPRPATASPYHAIAFRIPEERKLTRWMRKALDALVKHERRKDSELNRLIDTLLVRGKKVRERGVRDDVRTNLYSFLRSAILRVDVGSNVLSAQAPEAQGLRMPSPVPATMRKLTEWAFGAVIPGEVSTNRSAKALKRCVELGLMEHRLQSVEHSDGEWEPLASIKVITDLFWKVLGVFEEVWKARRSRLRRGFDRRMEGIQAQIAREARQAALQRGSQRKAKAMPESAAYKALWRKEYEHALSRGLGEAQAAQTAAVRAKHRLKHGPPG